MMKKSDLARCFKDNFKYYIGWYLFFASTPIIFSYAGEYTVTLYLWYAFGFVVTLPMLYMYIIKGVEIAKMSIITLLPFAVFTLFLIIKILKYTVLTYTFIC